MIRLISFGMVCVLAVLGFALATKDITLKKLYDPIEDFQAEYRLSTASNGTFAEPKLSSSEQKAVKNQVVPALEAYLKRTGRWGQAASTLDDRCWDRAAASPSASERLFDGIQIYDKQLGSFTQANMQQRIYAFEYCGGWETPGWSGSMIFESNTLLGVYADQGNLGHRYSILDINQNGLSELLLIVSVKPDPDARAARILEFPRGAIRNLGDIDVGDQPWMDGPIAGEFCPNKTQGTAMKKVFTSSIIYVLKSSTPQFFTEQYDVNCNYQDVGVKARKVRDLTPIKPVLRPSGFTRIF